MNLKPYKTRLLGVTGGAVVVALAAGGVAYATAPSVTSPTTATTAATTASPGSARAAWRAINPAVRRDFRRDLRRLARHTVHAELIVKTPSGYKTVDIDRGRLTSVNATTITLTRPDGPVVSAALTTSTRYFGLPESKLAPGDRVLVAQTGGNAVVVGALPPKATTAAAG